jgi:hypothetical protein
MPGIVIGFGLAPEIGRDERDLVRAEKLARALGVLVAITTPAGSVVEIAHVTLPAAAQARHLPAGSLEHLAEELKHVVGDAWQDCHAVSVKALAGAREFEREDDSELATVDALGCIVQGS